MLYEQYRDDILNRYSDHSFTETVVGSFILVKLNEDVAGQIEVTGDAGVARFEYDDGPILSVGSEVTVSGFTNNPDYNGTHIVGAVINLSLRGIVTTYFEVAGIAYGTSETGGSIVVLVTSAQKSSLLDAYRNIREDLVGLRSEVMITVTEAQRDAWTGTPADGEGPIFNTDGTAELYNGTDWTPV